MAEIIPRLKRLWKDVFADDDDLIDRYFDVYFSPQYAEYLTVDGAVVSAAHILPVGDLVKEDGSAVPCAHIYAVATDASYRGRGCASQVTMRAVERALWLGFGAIVLHPADDHLFALYEKCGFKDAFYARHTVLARGELPPGAVPARRVSPEEYQSLRREQLAGTCHVDLDLRALEFQQFLCGKFGGGLFEVPGGCAVVECDGRRALVKELLCQDIKAAAASLAASVECDEYDILTPAAGGGDRTGMIFGSTGLQGWLGLCFD